MATLGLVSSEVAPLDLELADGPLDLLDVFDPVGTVDAPLQPPAKPKPAPRKRNRSKKDSAPATEPAGVALPAEVHPDAKFEESMAFFDDISGLDLVELPANKKSKH